MPDKRHLTPGEGRRNDALDCGYAAEYILQYRRRSNYVPQLHDCPLCGAKYMLVTYRPGVYLVYPRKHTCPLCEQVKGMFYGDKPHQVARVWNRWCEDAIAVADARAEEVEQLSIFV